MTRFSMLLMLCVGISFACSDKKNQSQEVDFSTIPEFTPKQLSQFDQVDSLYFGYLGVRSFPLADGSFILGIQAPSHLAHINKEGNSLLGITKKGRGPSEILQIGVPTKSNSDIHVYDRNKKSVMAFDLTLAPKNEFQISQNENLYVNNVAYKIGDEDYVVEMNSIDWMFDSEKSKYLIFSRYNSSTGSYGKTVRLIDRQYAQSESPAPPAPVKYYAEFLGGDRAISYSDKQLYAFSEMEESLFLYNTGSDHIAEVDFNFDTLRTISVSFPTEEITRVEIDSIKKVVQEAEILDNLVSRMPKLKTPIERMLIDHKNRFWLKSNLRGNHEKWFVMNQDGDIVKVVNLPKNTFLTHISEHHLGVRIDDSTFGLFEAVY
ncbi:MAG: hypothetical protein ABJH08_09210 [Balneola sp.]